jgi:hypothetical protein
MDVETMHPLWRVLGSLTASRPDGNVAPITMHLLKDGTAGWREDLAAALGTMPPNSRLLVAYDRGSIQRLRGLRLERALGWRRLPPAGEVLGFLEDAGYSLVWRCGVWPSVEAPRIAFPYGSPNAIEWLQKAGLWGGGGESLPLRAVARRFPRPRQWQRLTPGVALICEPSMGS